MCFDAAVFAAAMKAEGDKVGGFGECVEETFFRAEGEIGGRYYFDKVHIVVSRVVSSLGCCVQRVEMVICPRHGVAQILSNFFWQ